MADVDQIVTKAVIPAAGLGTRFLPATKATPKEMLPVVDTPAIQLVVEEAVAAGLDDVLMVTGRNKRPLEDHFDRAAELEATLQAKGDTEKLDLVQRSSDLASVRSKAERVADGWLVNGRKLWTSNAHRAHYMIALVRTSGGPADRHQGLSQLLVPMDTPGITVRPIVNQLGEHDFNEVTFDDAVVPHDHLIGSEGDGWKQVGSELALERSGPERYLSSTQLLLEMLDAADPDDERQAVALGRVVAQYGTLRQMSMGVAGMLSRGDNPAQAAALVKDQGALVEQAMPDIAHELFGGRADPGSPLALAMRYATLAVPSFSLRGGTREILRGIIAKGLDLR